MTATPIRALLSLATACALAVAAWAANAEPNCVSFPKNLDGLVHYTTVKRGNSTEHMLTTQVAIDAVRAGREIPNGTHVVLVDYRDSQVFRYFVMEKGQGWGADVEPARRTGDWQFQAFRPDRSVNLGENPARCQSCHQGQKNEQFLYTFEAMRRPK